MRRFAILSARASASAAASSRPTARRTRRPLPISPLTSPPTRTAARETRCTTARTLLVLEHERDEHVDLVAHRLAVLDLDALLLDPGRGDVAHRLVHARDPDLDRLLEAAAGAGADLDHPRDTDAALLRRLAAAGLALLSAPYLVVPCHVETSAFHHMRGVR